MTVLSLFCSLALAGIHLMTKWLRLLRVMPRSRWLSVAGGVSVAYIFVHVLPELNEQQEAFAELEAVNFLEHHVYLVALLGLCVFYGLDRLVTRQKEDSAGVFWLHIGSFTLYNALTGYLLVHRETPGTLSLLFFVVALGLHFIVNDHGLRLDHPKTYDRYGRWLLAGAVLVGWGVGVLTEVSGALLAALFAFLAGGVILNVLKEELPEERQSRFSAFIVGAAAYAVLLLL